MEQNQYKPSAKNQIGILVATILGSSLVFIDGTVINVILPILQKDFKATAIEIQWVVEAYLLFLASLILIGGSLGDRFGRKNIFMLGTLLFILSSLGSALSNSLWMMTLFRSLQGVGGALLTPGSLAIINTNFEKSERGKAIGTWSGFSALAVAFGPLLGGFLSDQFSWRWVFLINIPFGVATLSASLKYIPKDLSDRTKKLDFLGSALSTPGTGALIFGLIESKPLFMVVGIGILVIFFWAESRIKNPLLPLALFKSRMFSTVNGATFLLYAGLSITFYFLPFNLIQMRGYSATAAGAAGLPFVIIVFLSSRFAGGLYHKLGPRIPISFGSALVAIGFALLAFLPEIFESYWAGFLPGLVLFGIGMSLCISPLTTAVLMSVPETDSGIASSINNSITRLGGLIGVAIMTFLMIKFFSHGLDKLNLALELKTEILKHSKELGEIHGFSNQIQQQITEVYEQSYKKMMICTAALVFAASAFSYLMIPNKTEVS